MQRRRTLARPHGASRVTSTLRDRRGHRLVFRGSKSSSVRDNEHAAARGRAIGEHDDDIVMAGVQRTRDVEGTRLTIFEIVEPKLVSVAVKAPRATLCSHLDPGLIVPIEQLVGDLATGVFVGEFEGFGAKPLRVDDGDEAIWQDAWTEALGRRSSSLLIAKRPNTARRWPRSVKPTFRRFSSSHHAPPRAFPRNKISAQQLRWGRSGRYPPDDGGFPAFP